MAGAEEHSGKRRFSVPKAPELLAGKIRQQIVSGDLKEGDILPTEAILMARFGVSRPTIREAYRILEAQHLLSITRGAKGGAVVHEPDSDLVSDYFLLLLQTERATIAEIYQARNAFEPGLARLLAQEANSTAPSVLRRCLAEERATMEDPERFSRAVTDFHRAVVELSGNRPLLHLFDAIYSVIQRHQASVIAQFLREGTESGQLLTTARGLNSQEKLIEYVERGDATGAETHWREHMEHASRVWIAGFESTTILELTQA